MRSQYTKEEKIAAIKLYEKLGHKTWVMRELGYPLSRTMLSLWIEEYQKTGFEGLEKKKKYSDEQRKTAVEYYLTHGMSVTKTITALGYPGKTLMCEWLNEDVPKDLRKWSCKAAGNVVRCSTEQKEEAVKQYCSGEKPQIIAERFSVSPGCVRGWAKQMLGKENVSTMQQRKIVKHEGNEETSEELKTAIKDLQELRDNLEHEVYHLQMQKDILEKAGEILKKDNGIYLDQISNKEKAELIDALRNKYRLKELLTELHINKSSYCYQSSQKKKEDKYANVRIRIKSIFDQNYMSYGYRRIYEVLKRDGVVLSEKVIRRIMKEDGLYVRQTEHRKYSSYKGEITPEVPNIINRNFKADIPNQKWLTDITEFHIPAGKVYLSPMIDCFDGEVISWTIGTSPDAELVNCMLDSAVSTLNKDEHPIIHTDRGCHYRWPGWIERMNSAELVRSMSKKACSPDNSACEGFFGRMKNEMFYGRSWIGVSIEQFIDTINQYIFWYNGKRIKKTLGYMSPFEYRISLGLFTNNILE